MSSKEIGPPSKGNVHRMKIPPLQESAIAKQFKSQGGLLPQALSTFLTSLIYVAPYPWKIAQFITNKEHFEIAQVIQLLSNTQNIPPLKENVIEIVDQLLEKSDAQTELKIYSGERFINNSLEVTAEEIAINSKPILRLTLSIDINKISYPYIMHYPFRDHETLGELLNRHLESRLLERDLMLAIAGWMRKL